MYTAVISSMRQLTVASLIFLPCSLSFATEFVRPRPLTEYADILLAQELDTAINVLNARLTQCVDSNAESPSDCYCRYPQEAGAAKASYEKVLQARPKWKGKILFWKNMQNLASHNLVMPAIENQLRSSTQGCSSSSQQ
jgi:hypothetical protein